MVLYATFREKKFYDDVFNGKDEVHKKFQQVMPKYYGTCIKVGKDKGRSIKGLKAAYGRT